MLDIVEKLTLAIKAKNISAAKDLLAALKVYCEGAALLGEEITLQSVINEKLNSQNDTLLILAADSGCDAIIPDLIQAGADVTSTTTKQETALYRAAFKGYVKAVQELCKAGLALKPVPDSSQLVIDYQTQRHFSPLMEAAWCGSPEITQCLLEQKADVHATDDQNLTALFWAANPWVSSGRNPTEQQQVAVIKQLVQAGALVNVQNNFGGTPLVYAVCSGRPAVVQVLLESKADVNQQGGSKNLSPLDHAIEFTPKDGQSEIKEADRAALITVLLSAKPEQKFIDSAFLKAVGKGYEHVVKAFVANPVSPSLEAVNQGLVLAREHFFKGIEGLLLRKQTELEAETHKQEQKFQLQQKAKEWDEIFHRSGKSKDEKEITLKETGFTKIKDAIFTADSKQFNQLLHDDTFKNYHGRVLKLLCFAIDMIPLTGSAESEKIALMLIADSAKFQIYHLPNGKDKFSPIHHAVNVASPAVVTALLEHYPHTQLYDKEGKFRFDKEKSQRDNPVAPILTLKAQEVDLLDCWYVMCGAMACEKAFLSAYKNLEMACKTPPRVGDSMNKEWEQALRDLNACRFNNPVIFNKLLGLKDSHPLAAEKWILESIYKNKAPQLMKSFADFRKYIHAHHGLNQLFYPVTVGAPTSSSSTTPFWAAPDESQLSSSSVGVGVVFTP